MFASNAKAYLSQSPFRYSLLANFRIEMIVFNSKLDRIALLYSKCMAYTQPLIELKLGPG